jgi:hypothetical protein
VDAVMPGCLPADIAQQVQVNDIQGFTHFRRRR